MVGIVVSVLILGAGLWLTVGPAGSGMGMFGAMILVLGGIFLAVNLYLWVKGFRMRRRRP